MDVFKDIIPTLLQNNDYISDVETEYVPFLVNKALANHIDCIFYVDEMNNRPNLDKKLQYDYYFYSLKKYKRKYSKWMKDIKSKDVLMVMAYYNCNYKKAKEYNNILTKEQLQVISTYLDTGGKV